MINKEVIDVRDPKRIYTICNRLAAAWSASPDLRLGQLIVNAVYTSNSNGDPFYIEDEALINAIERFMGHADSKGRD